MQKLIAVTMALLTMVTFAEPTVTDVTAKQRYPWNGLVDITCKVTGINGTTNGLYFDVTAVDTDSGNARNVVPHLWVVQNGMNSTDYEVHSNNNYRLLWDARADFGEVIYSNMVVHVTLDKHKRVQLWEGGPYWAETNIGADEPWEYGYYFWWGDTVGYKRENNAWVANDGSTSSFSFSDYNVPTYGKNNDTLKSEGWITTDGVLASGHDAAQVKWGGKWRMPTKQELEDLNSKCDWTRTTLNNVKGYIVRGKGDFAASSIFLPFAGLGLSTLTGNPGSLGSYWSSVPASGIYYAWTLELRSNEHSTSDSYNSFRDRGRSVRPVQGFTGTQTTTITHAVDSAPFLLDTRTGVRESDGTETLAYSSLWGGGNGATVLIAQDGMAIAEGLTGEDTYDWSVTRNGTYVLTHTTYTNGVAGEVETATFVVTGKDVPFAVGDVTVTSYAEKYDGVAHGITVVSEIAGIAYKYTSGAAGATSPTGEWSNVAPTLTDVGSMTVWCEISAPGYITQTNSAMVTITPREVTLTSGSASKMYDGAALVKHEVTVGGDGFAVGEGATYSYTGSQTEVGTSENAFTYTLNDGTEASNYEILVMKGSLVITEAFKPLVIRCEWLDDAIRPASMDFMIQTNGAAWHVETVTAADGWKKKIDVKEYDQGVPIDYSLVALPTDGVRSEIETLGCRTTGSLTLLDKILTETGWRTVGPATINTVVATVDGWTTWGSLSMLDLVVAEDTARGVFFKVSNCKATFDIDDGTDGTGGAASRFSYSGVYDGVGHGINVEVANAPTGMSIKYACGDASVAPTEGWSMVNPLFTNVCDNVVVWYAVECAGYVSYTNNATVTITPKTLTDDMVVLSDAAFFYDPGSEQKKPDVVVADTNAVGVVISTANDYTLEYGSSTSAGLIPVTVTGRNNYIGTITKTFPILKRPVAPPVIGSKSYNGRTQRASIPTDERWTVVENPGGIHAGEYTNVVLRLTNPADYRWKVLGEDETDWTGVFVITKANNGWSRYPGIQSWMNGVQTASEPVGQPRYGTLSVAYRRQGSDISTETATKPSLPGKYIARFWVEPTENYIGVAMTTPYEVEFEIFRGPNDTQTETQTTPVPVPYTWLDAYLAKYGAGDYEDAGKAMGANGCPLWESYVAGLDPDDATSKFRAKIEMLADGTPKVTWEPDMSNADPPRTYTTLGKTKLTDGAWTPVSDANKSQMHFFKMTVEIK